MIVRVIGDVHGKMGGYFDILDNLYEEYPSEDVYTIQIGDMGFSEEYRQRERWMSVSDKYENDHHVFFGGNHDDYDHYFDTKGSLGDFGEIPFLSNSFFMRGAYSIDKSARTIGRDWWEEEELGWQRSNEAFERYIELKPERMFTHDAPEKVAERMFFYERKDISTHTGQVLDKMFDAHKPKQWFFGHWHRDAKTSIFKTEFVCLNELGYIDIKVED